MSNTQPAQDPRQLGLIFSEMSLSKAQRATPDFLARAKAVVLAHLGRHGPTSGEDLTDACKAAGLRPHDDRAFGGVFMSLSKRSMPMIVCLRADLVRRHGHGTSGGRLWGLV